MLRPVALFVGLFVGTVFAQNPVPQVIGPVKPSAVVTGSGSFILTVFGANFVPGAVVNWNGQPRSTTFVSARELQAQILATDVATNTAGLISVTNPAPGGGNSSSSWAQVEVHVPVSSIALNHPKFYPVGMYLLMAADFTHHQALDLLGQSQNSVVFYPGKGNGTFHFQSLAAGLFREGGGGAFGDFNNDGNLDFVYGQFPPGAGTLGYAVMLGNGSGGFTYSWAASNATYPNFSGGTWVGDFNLDGNLDLILADHSGFSLFLGNGDGTFRHGVDVTTLEGPQDIQLGDFNGDGRLDVMVVVNPSGGGTANVYFFAGNGDGTFQPPQTVFSSTKLQGWGLQVSDFNGDGKLDLAFQTASQIGIMLGNGDGTFQPPSYVTVGGNRPYVFVYAVGDFYSDGRPGLLASWYIDAQLQFFTFFRGNGDGTFQKAETLRDNYTGFPIVLGDFNSDGLVDFSVSTGLGMDVYLRP